MGVSCLSPPWEENPGQKAQAVYTQAVPGAGGAEVVLGWVRDRLKVWCAVHASSPRWQVINIWLLNPSRTLAPTEFPPLVCLYLRNVLYWTTTGGFFLMCWIELGKCSLLPCMSLSPAMSCCAARGPLRSWDMHTGKPSPWGRCKGSECSICCLQALLEKSVARGEVEGKILPPRIWAAQC